MLEYDAVENAEGVYANSCRQSIHGCDALVLITQGSAPGAEPRGWKW